MNSLGNIHKFNVLVEIVIRTELCRRSPIVYVVYIISHFYGTIFIMLHCFFFVNYFFSSFPNKISPLMFYYVERSIFHNLGQI